MNRPRAVSRHALAPGVSFESRDSGVALESHFAEAMPRSEVQLIREKRIAKQNRANNIQQDTPFDLHEDDDLPDDPQEEEEEEENIPHTTTNQHTHTSHKHTNTKPTTTNNTHIPQINKAWETKIHIDQPQQVDDMFCVSFSQDDILVAVGSADGAVRIFNADNGKHVYTLIDHEHVISLPATCMRFRPGTNSSKMRNILLVAGADGTVRHWHVTSRKCVNFIQEANNQVNAVEFNHDGSMFATAGRDTKVRLYDEETRRCLHTLCGTSTSGIDRMSGGHSNRIFALKWGDDPHTLLSAGWDNTVQIWDTRHAKAVSSIYGPHVCGDAIDIRGDILLTGSWRPSNQLQEWDIRNGQLAYEYDWGNDIGGQGCSLYAAKYSRNEASPYVFAGGSGSNELKVFSYATRLPICGATLPKGLYGLSVSRSGTKVAAVVGDDKLRTFEMPTI